MKLTGLSRGVYQHICKPFFFSQDPELVHERMVKLGSMLGKRDFFKNLIQNLYDYENKVLEQNILGVKFRNPIGLAAGFDKDGKLAEIVSSVGFGFTEIGSVTGMRCDGNPKPRLWRIPESKSIAVHYGLKNDGCDVVAKRISKINANIPIGISVAMTNCTENLVIKNAVKDYAKAFRTMEPYADYMTINISCPNTHGGQPFSSHYKLDYLLDLIDAIPTKKPIFVKLSPDLVQKDLDGILDVLRKHRVHGIICANLTKIKENPLLNSKIHGAVKGGFSGKAVQNRADALLSHIYKRENGRFVLVGCGGVSSAEDAYKKICLGASLVQLVTGMIYEGPQLVGEINKGIVDLLKRDGYSSIKEAIGTAV